MSAQGKALRRMGHEAYVADMREGRRFRSQVLNPNKRKDASRKACRKGNW